MEIVLLEKGTQFVAQVSLLSFQSLAPEKVKDLIEVFENSTSRWKFYTYKISRPVFNRSIERWASWLTYHDLRAIQMNELDDTLGIHITLRDAKRIGDVDFQDALVDAWMSWLQDMKPAGDLSVERLQLHVAFQRPDRLYDLRCALILHHDADAIDLEHIENADDSDSPYDYSTCSKVRSFALGYFCQPQREPKDPLQLSNEEFCKKHHAHHAKGLPCYKTKSLPKET
jgi:hypothetical protein